MINDYERTSANLDTLKLYYENLGLFAEKLVINRQSRNCERIHLDKKRGLYFIRIIKK